MEQGQKIPVIAIDGPSASGKGTIAQRVAQTLGFHYLDSGALYRLVALASLKHGIAPEAYEALGMLARGLDVAFGSDGVISLDGQDVTEELRQEACGNLASQLAAIPQVRQGLLQRQHQCRQQPGLVADGRDMGSVVFPDAELKVFLTASAEARAERRYNQLKLKGITANIHTLLQDILERDHRDRTRQASPLSQVEGAHHLDTTGLGIDQVVQQVMGWVAQAGLAKD
jgi:cytidylate kinase